MSTYMSKVESEREMLGKPENVVTRFFQEARHTEEIVGMPEDPEERDIWRKYGKDRMKTVSVALILCLHLGVDPPDRGPRPQPCAKIEAWCDPTDMNNAKATNKIAQSLQKQYERWQPRARYKVATDPTVEDVRRLMISMRRNAKEERVLFHYNGHGVPRPTINGEIWVFNKNFTQYIPLSVYDLQSWVDTPAIYIWDCDSAETIVNSFHRFADDHEKVWRTELEDFQERTDDLPPIDSSMTPEEQAEAIKFPKKRPRFKQDCIQLAACKENQTLPMHPELPADLFTSCLTTPIHTSILWYLIRTDQRHKIPNIMEDIPGALTDRRTLLGELNWIFTAITDTMAWNALPRDVFQRLFRQDLLLASLFRSFLLAERIMGMYGCTVVSNPVLPSTAEHPLWEAWDYTIDLCMSHLLSERNREKENIVCKLGRDYFAKSEICPLNTLIDLSSLMKTDNMQFDSQYNSFFIEQLRAFEVWLEYGVEKKTPPQQLPVVLQVLLSQVHRVRALELLARFLDHGQWAVGYALSVGIFPYVLKLLQSSTRELKPWLAFIWAKILAVDPGCQQELFKENGEETTRYDSLNGQRRDKKELRYEYFYFVKMLNDPQTPSRQKVVPAFVLATLFHNSYKEESILRTAQSTLVDQGYANLCTELLLANSSLKVFKVWILIGLGRLWSDFNGARWQAVRTQANDKVEHELEDSSPEVRAATVYALGCLVRNRPVNNEHATVVAQQVCDKLCSTCTRDGAMIVREELLVALQYFVCDSWNMLANLHRRLTEQARSMPSRVEEEEMEPIHVEAGMTDDSVMDKSWMSSRSDRQSSSLTSSSSHHNHHHHRRRKKEASESSVAIDELVTSLRSAEAASSAAAFRYQYAFTSEDIVFREETLKMLAILESKSFADPHERVWIAVLQLALDPIQKIAKMAQVLVRYVAQFSEQKAKLQNEFISSLSSADLSYRSETPNRTRSRVLAGDRLGRGGGSNNGLVLDVSAIDNDDEGPSFTVKGTPPRGTNTTTRNHNGDVENGVERRAKDDMNLNERGVTFTVGSPQPAFMLSTTPINNFNLSGMTAGPSNSLNTPLGPTRKLSCPPLTSTPKPSASAQAMKRDRDGFAVPQAPSALGLFPSLGKYDFLPKRKIAEKLDYDMKDSRMPGTSKDEMVEQKPYEALIETQFVPWCSRVFTEPILDQIQSESGDWMIDSSVLTQANPTDWAIHFEEGLRQLSADEFARMHEKPDLMGEHRWMYRRESGRRLTACAFSHLRPYLYCTDGDSIEMLMYDTHNKVNLVNSFPNHAGNPFSSDKANWLQVLNPMSTEMLMSASSNGIIRVWDVHLNVHSYEMEKETSLITAAFPLSDQKRMIEKGVAKGCTTIYDWCQSRGQLLCAGNVKVCRVWDAHMEKAKCDIQTGRRSAVVALSSELDSTHLVALGFRDGAIDVHDVRMPSTESRILSLAEHTRPIVGVSIRSTGETRSLLSAASCDGLLCVWEPRMYKEPVVDVNLLDEKSVYDTSVLNMRMHENAQMLSCALSSSTVQVFDISGRLISPLRPFGAQPLLRPDVQAFHPYRCLLAVAAGAGADSTVSVFGPPEKTTRNAKDDKKDRRR